MFSTPEKFSLASKAQFETQLATITALTNKAFESVAQLVDLNVSAAKATFEQSTATAQQLLAAKDSQAFMALASQGQPNADKALAYGRTLASIASSAQAEFAKVAEEQIAETTRKVTSLVDELAKNAPAGSENAVALLKTAVANANASYEQLSKGAKQASEALETNVAAAVQQFTQATEKTGRASKK